MLWKGKLVGRPQELPRTPSATKAQSAGTAAGSRSLFSYDPVAPGTPPLKGSLLNLNYFFQNSQRQPKNIFRDQNLSP